MLWKLPLARYYVAISTRKKFFCVTPTTTSKAIRIYCSSAEKVATSEKLEGEKNALRHLIRGTLQEKSSLITPSKPLRSKMKPMPKYLKYILSLLGISGTFVGTYFVVTDEHAREKLSQILDWLTDIKKRVEFITSLIQEPSREKLLPDPVTYPYYQPPYTLVLEFTDVLAHPDWTYQTGWRFKKRPGVDYMLENLVGLYEIVVFTAENGMTIFPVIEALDQNNLVSYKLVRDSTHFVDGHHVKNLDRLNRDLRKVIVVDWDARSLKFHPENHLQLPRWKGEDDDATLIDLTAFLTTIAETEIEDVREVLKFYKQYDNPLKEFRNKQKEYYSQQQEQPVMEKPSKAIRTVFDYIM